MKTGFLYYHTRQFRFEKEKIINTLESCTTEEQLQNVFDWGKKILIRRKKQILTKLFYNTASENLISEIEMTIILLEYYYLHKLKNL